MTGLHIIRTLDNGRQTRGYMVVMEGGVPRFACLSLELPWRDNERRVSCIPPMRYRGRKHESPKFGKCISIDDVPNRSNILIHPANKVDDLLGCVAPGLSTADINRDGLPDVTNSRFTMEKLMKALPDEFDVVVSESDDFMEFNKAYGRVG